MIKNVFLILPLLCFPLIAHAQEAQNDSELMRKAVTYAAQSDAYNLYCENETALAQKFIDKLVESKRASEEQEKNLVSLMDKNKSETYQNLKNECKNVEFMLKRLEIMRALKNVSYLLNGVAPEDIPEDNIPNIEDLMPPRSAPIDL